jgi:hypothetical protein
VSALSADVALMLILSEDMLMTGVLLFLYTCVMEFWCSMGKLCLVAGYESGFCRSASEAGCSWPPRSERQSKTPLHPDCSDANPTQAVSHWSFCLTRRSTTTICSVVGVQTVKAFPHSCDQSRWSRAHLSIRKSYLSIYVIISLQAIFHPTPPSSALFQSLSSSKLARQPVQSQRPPSSFSARIESLATP